MNTFPTPLAQLEHADLIRRLREMEDAYQFKHNLIQESAYSSLLKNDRRALHRACAAAMEHAFPNDLDEHAALLAKHYAEAGDDAKTFEYARRAGDAAARVSAYAEALMHYDTAVLLAARLAPDAPAFTALHLKRGRILELMGEYAQAIDAYRALADLGQARGEAYMEMQARLSLATLFTFPNPAQNIREAFRLNQAALQLAREIQDEPAQARALWNMQQYAYFTGRASDAVRYSAQALELTDRLGLLELRAYILNDVSRALVTAQGVPSALEALSRAGEIFRATDNLPMLADNLSTLAEATQIHGDLTRAEDFIRQSQELSRTIGNVWNLAYSNTTLLTVTAQRGEYARTLDICAETIELAAQSGFVLAAQVAITQRAIIYGELGAPERGIEILQQQSPQHLLMMLEAWRAGGLLNLYLMQNNLPAAREMLAHAQSAVHSDDLSTFGPIFVTLGAAEIALHEKRYTDAITPTRELAARLRALEFRFFFSDLVLRQGRAHLGLGELDAAAVVLDEAEEVARSMQARPVLWQILMTRSELETRRGDTGRARAARQEARAILEWLAAHAPPEFRASFLNMPQVREVPA